jgi:molecular chaperone HscB
MNLQAAQKAVAHAVESTVDGVMPCWSCKGPVACGIPFCPICVAVQPPGQADHFARLGVEHTFDLDDKTLDRRYFDLLRHLHPDRFATKTPCERMLSQQQATSLNEAYETLRDPLRRATYLAILDGRDPLGDEATMANDPELLMETMERREALAEAETLDAVEAVAAAAVEEAAGCVDALSAAFRAGDIDGACRLILRLKYLRKLGEETRGRRAVLAQG